MVDLQLGAFLRLRQTVYPTARMVFRAQLLHLFCYNNASISLSAAAGLFYY